MFYKIHTILIFVSFALLFTACSESPVNNEASKTTIANLNQDAGFAWFESNASKYEPKTPYLNMIQSEFVPGMHKINIFVKPSCTCEGNHNYFPMLVKILREAGISEDNYDLYVMTRPSDKHPFSEILTLKDLPEFVIFKDGVPVYSIVENIVLGENGEFTRSMEQLLLDGLQK